MKKKLYKQLDSNYYITVCQIAPEYSPFYELRKKGWIWDSLVVWSDSLETVEDRYKVILKYKEHYDSL